MATSLVVTHEKLVGEDGRQNLGAVVVEASMPNAVIQFDKSFEPVVERLDCLATACIQTLSFTTLEKLLTRQASPMRLIAWFGRLASRRLLAATAVFRAQKTPTRPLALRVVLQVLAQLIAVVTAVGQHIGGFLRQFLDLVGKGLRFLRARRIDRGRQREDGASARGRDNHFKAVALHPTVVLRITPRALAIHAVQPFGNTVVLPV